MYKNTNYKPLDGLKSEILFISILVLSYVATRASEVSLVFCKRINPTKTYFQLYIFQYSVLLHITIGGVFFLLTLAVWAFLNKDLWRLGFNKYKRRLSLKTD